MTRRNFLKKILFGCLAAVAGAWVITKQAVKKFVRAEKCENYPGPVKRLTDIDNISKWSG